MTKAIVGCCRLIGGLFFVGILSGSSCLLPTEAAANGDVERASICALMAAPKQYTGKTVEVIARITRTKEGIGLWDPSCGNLGVDLLIDFDETDKPGFKELEEALKAHGLSDHPVIATVQGVFTFNQYDKFKKQKRTVLVASSVFNVHQSSDVEHRSDSHDSAGGPGLTDHK